MPHSRPEAASALENIQSYLAEQRQGDPSFSDIIRLAEVMADSLQSFFALWTRPSTANWGRLLNLFR